MKYPKYASSNKSILPSHGQMNPGPENSEYDVSRHEKMRLKPLVNGGTFATIGSKPSKDVCPTCDRLKVWCTCVP